MAGLKLKYKLDLSRIEGSFKRLSAADTTPLMNAIGTHQLSETQRNFKEGRTPAGAKWVPSGAAGLRAKNEDAARPGKTLIDRGLLLKSYTYKASRTSVVLGSNKVYAAIHHFGYDEKQPVKSHNRLVTQAFGKALRGPTWQTVGSFNRKMKMIPRPALGITAEDEKEYKELTQKFVSQFLKGGSQ